MLTQQCTENYLQLVTTTFTQSAREKGVDFEFHMLEDADIMCVVSDLIEGRVESMQQSSSLHLFLGRLRKIVACSQPYLAVLFGKVSTLHLMIFTLVSLIFSSHRHGKR